MKIVTASDANRQFSKFLRDVRQGEVITVLSRGKAVATISPAKIGNHAREAAKRRLIDRLNSQEVIGARDWMRDGLYD